VIDLRAARRVAEDALVLALEGGAAAPVLPELHLGNFALPHRERKAE
jgi:hypothetical protein